MANYEGSAVERKFTGCRCASPQVVNRKGAGPTTSYCARCRETISLAKISEDRRAPLARTDVGSVVRRFRGHLGEG